MKRRETRGFWFKKRDQTPMKPRNTWGVWSRKRPKGTNLLFCLFVLIQLGFGGFGSPLVRAMLGYLSRPCSIQSFPCLALPELRSTSPLPPGFQVRQAATEARTAPKVFMGLSGRHNTATGTPFNITTQIAGGGGIRLENHLAHLAKFAHLGIRSISKGT